PRPFPAGDRTKGTGREPLPLAASIMVGCQVGVSHVGTKIWLVKNLFSGCTRSGALGYRPAAGEWAIPGTFVFAEADIGLV
ncbi:MAG: hypothetical protein V3W34_03460, partial [Phycisphaerae bacterium]